MHIVRSEWKRAEGFGAVEYVPANLVCSAHSPGVQALVCCIRGSALDQSQQQHLEKQMAWEEHEI